MAATLVSRRWRLLPHDRHAVERLARSLQSSPLVAQLLLNRGVAEPTAAREPRPGFDDAAHAMATIGLDGHFRELNQKFSDLVGYPEAEFEAATWPPVMDRANLPKHREQMEQMLEGSIESAEVNTGYVHAQGLLVPVAGRISLVRQDGQPAHFLLEVDAA